MFLPNPGVLAAGVGGAPVGQQLFLASGDFVVPDGVFKISIVAIGRGADATSTESGAGGALACANDISVTPGEVLSVVSFGSASVRRAITNLVSVTAGNRSTPGQVLAGTGFPGGAGASVSGTDRRGGGAGGYTSAGGGAGTVSSSLGGGGSSPLGGGPGAQAGAAPTVNGESYGGGGGRSRTFGDGQGGPSCVRIIWGPGRAFPNTNTGDL